MAEQENENNETIGSNKKKEKVGFVDGSQINSDNGSQRDSANVRIDTGAEIDSNAANDDDEQQSEASEQRRGPFQLAWDKDKYFQTLFDKE